MENNTFSRGFIGRKRITLSSTPSTNDFLKDQLAKSTPFPEGTVIMAVEQFNGKGQHGAVWQSETGQNLTFSVLLYPKGRMADQPFFLTVAVSLAIADFLETLLPQSQSVKVKWPNDIYVDGRKIAGVLIENNFSGKNWKHSVVGIGLNVNQVQFPSEISARLSSLKLVTHQEFDLNELLDRLCEHLESRCMTLRSGQFAELRSDYYERLYQFGEVHTYWVDGIAVPGKIVGVTPEGRLQLDFNGHLVDFGMKEISFFGG